MGISIKFIDIPIKHNTANFIGVLFYNMYTIIPLNHLLLFTNIYVDGTDILRLLMIHAAVATVPTIILLIWFEEKPPTPPSASAATVSNQANGYKEAARRLVTEKNWVLLWFIFGIMTGAYPFTRRCCSPVAIMRFWLFSNKLDTPPVTPISKSGYLALSTLLLQ